MNAEWYNLLIKTHESILRCRRTNKQEIRFYITRPAFKTSLQSMAHFNQPENSIWKFLRNVIDPPANHESQIGRSIQNPIERRSTTVSNHKKESGSTKKINLNQEAFASSGPICSCKRFRQSGKNRPTALCTVR